VTAYQRRQYSNARGPKLPAVSSAYNDDICKSTYWYRWKSSCHLQNISYRTRRIQSHAMLTPIGAPMSDTVRIKSMGQTSNLEKADLRLAHFQGGWLEFLHIGVPFKKVSHSSTHSRKEAWRGSDGCRGSITYL
jgi:hypothetical protein